MSSQSSTPTEPSGISTAVCVSVVIAGAAAVLLVTLGGFDYAGPYELPRGLSGFLAATITVGSVAAIVRSALDILTRRLDQLERRLDERGEQVATFGEQRYQAGHDDGFVDGAAGPSPQVQSLNGRRPRPVTHG